MGQQMRRIAVLTSSGDAPGMNAAIRAVVRAGLSQGCETLGIRHGYTGLMTGDFVELGPRTVGGIEQQGGTKLGSTRWEEFRTEAGRRRALVCLVEHDIDGLVVIGGNGSQQGSPLLSGMGFPVVGVAWTIDNNLAGSDITLGVDTALNVALEAIDRLKTTASSHHRAFVVEVMGRDRGYLALMAGIAGGAEAIAIPEVEAAPSSFADEVRSAYQRGKAHAIIVVSEHATCNAERLERYFAEHRELLGFELRTTTLGHVQRGGAPGAFDRLLGSRLGAGAVEYLLSGRHGVLSGVVGGDVVATPLAEVVDGHKCLDPRMLRLAPVLAA